MILRSGAALRTLNGPAWLLSFLQLPHGLHDRLDRLSAADPDNAPVDRLTVLALAAVEGEMLPLGPRLGR